ncbi:uncharacterized protein G2W53_045212 [Senna tora]|uniref:Uncharacterized protein n=1 Tax=Senna tora TaxID=362788 RepID=A0A834SC29_9FABA|nr:uncharacterized protein G2W53_045212 [Senna tora]
MTQGSLPRSFKAIRVGSPAVDHVDRRPSKSMSRGSNFFLGKISRACDGSNEAYDTRKPPKKFQGHPSRSPVVDHVDRRPPKINHPWPMTQGSLTRSFKAIRVGRPAVDHVDRRPPKINESWRELFFYAKSHVHMMGQDEAYDTRKPPKKFQANPTCARPNHRWTTTWIAVGRRPPKINHSWAESHVHVMGQNEAYDTRKLPRSFKAIRLAPRPNLRWTRLGSPSTQINHPWVNFFSRQNLRCILLSQIDPYDTRKLPKVSRPSESVAGVRPRDRPPHPKINHPWVNFFSRQ